MKITRPGCLVLAIALFSVLPRSSAAQPAKPQLSFDWYAELVSTDAAKKTVTAKAPMSPHVGRYIGKFQPGQSIVAVWQQFGGAGDVISYVVPAEGTAIEGGYVVKGEYVASDATANTFTFATAAPDPVIRTLSTAAPGTAIKVHAAMIGEAAKSPIINVALNEKPKPRPEVKVAEPVIDPNDAVVAGTWVLETSVMNNALKFTCDLTQQGKKLEASVPALGQSESFPASGTVSGKAVVVQFELSSFGPTLTFLHRGEVDAQGAAIKGTLNMMGSDSAFTMTKKQ